MHHVGTENVLDLIERAAGAASIAAPRGPWRDIEYRHTFDQNDPDRITGALGWVLAAAGVHAVYDRRAVADLTEMPYHLWPAIRVDGAGLFEPDLRVLRALDAACRSEPRHAAAEARAAVIAS